MQEVVTGERGRSYFEIGMVLLQKFACNHLSRKKKKKNYFMIHFFFYRVEKYK